jgi:hypothetical protein
VRNSKTKTYSNSAALVENIELNASNTLPLNVDFVDTAYNPLIRAADRRGTEYVVRVSRILRDSPVTQKLRNEAMEAFYKAGRFEMLHATLVVGELPTTLLVDFLSRDRGADFLRSIRPHTTASQSLKANLPEVLTYTFSEKSTVSTDLVFESLWRCARIEFKQRKVVSLEDLFHAVDKPPVDTAEARMRTGQILAVKQNHTSGLADRLSQLLNDYVDKPEVFGRLVWEGVPVSTDTFQKVLEARKLDIARLILIDFNWRKQNSGLLRKTLLIAIEKRDTPNVELFKDFGMLDLLTEKQLDSMNSQLGGS